jgi:Predicted membrane protein (DUF2339)
VLLLLAVVFILPLGLWVALYRTRTRMMLVEREVEQQKWKVEELSVQLAQLARSGSVPPSPHPAEAAPTSAPKSAAVERPYPEAAQPASPPPHPAPAAPPAPARPEPVHIPPASPTVSPVARPVPPVPEPPPRPPADAVQPPRPAVPMAAPAASRAGAATPSRQPLPSSAPAGGQTPPPPRPPRAAAPSFDWESLIGVKLFSAIAGIATVLAAILFLRYSMQEGWLQPPIRVLIGVAVAIALLVVCELKAARAYPATANALDAAAIAILFATFFAAHALWNLIPSLVAFGLLAAVTVLAVLLSIRRESLFIAMLGLVGGFTTPALLSAGENRPIPLFAYLALLNIGLAWVAYRQTWPVLTVLTLVLTTAYQWIWVFKFLSANQLSLAMGIFALFPILSVAGLILGRRERTAGGRERDTFERTTVVAIVLPLLFVAYLATVPAYGTRPGLLFGFLLLIDAGLFAVSVALRRSMLHALGAMATVFVWAAWLTSGYSPDTRMLAVAFTTAFVLLYLFSPSIADRFDCPLDDRGVTATYAAPLLLFVFPVIVRIDPTAAAPWPVFAPLLVLLLLCAWRAVMVRRGGLFFIASFLAVAAQASWSATHLTIERLPAAVLVYALFGVASAAVPVVARRAGRPLEPQAGGGLVLLGSLALLLFLASGSIAPAALWALALLLAILNAAMFIESASSRVPLLSQVGTVLSWAILALWWLDTAGAVGLLPSLAVMTGLTLITLGGHAWAYRSASGDPGRGRASGFGQGLYLGLIGHLFLFFVAVNREWSLPPWPMFGALGAITLAAGVVSLFIGAPMLHVAGIGGAAIVIAGWTAAAGVMPWTQTGVIAAAVLTLGALAWIPIRRRAHRDTLAPAGAAVALFGGELAVLLASAGEVPPSFTTILAAHLGNLAALLALTHTYRWSRVAAGAVIVSCIALFQWQTAFDLATEWQRLLILASAFYALFTIYALVAGPRVPEQREPWLVALTSAAMTFFAARSAFKAGDLEWMIGIIPVVQGLVTAGLLRTLLRIEGPGERDLTRLALVAGAALAFVTVAIPLQLEHQWITIGWAVEGAALAWLYRRVPHRGLLIACTTLLTVVFVRLTLNPSVWIYEPRGELRILNWYLYTYLLAAAAMLLSAWYLSKTNDRLTAMLPGMSTLLPAAAVIVLFWLLNIEIADYYATGPAITFRFGVTVSQDLTYTIGWLAFGILLLAAGIYLKKRPARVTAVLLIAVTTFKCFLYDLSSLEGLYRVASFVGLAMALALVSLALQKYVLAKPKGAA